MNLRNRTGTENTDHVQSTLDRERTNTPGVGKTVDLPKQAKDQKAVKFSTTAQMESCEVCGGSFLKGRGLSIHQTKAGCRAVMESRKSKYKSTSSGLQDLNHSDSTHPDTFHDIPVLNDEVLQKKDKTAPVKNRNTQTDSLVSNSEKETIQGRSKDQEERLVEKSKAIKNDNILGQSEQLEAKKAKHKQGKFEKYAKKSSMDIKRFCVKSEKRCAAVIPEEVACQKEGMVNKRKTPEKMPMKEETRSKGLTITPKVLNLAKEDEEEFVLISDEEESSQGQVEKSSRTTNETTVKQQDIRTWFDTARVTPSDSKEASFKKLVEEVNTGPPDDVISKHIIEMTRRDYRSLSGRNWINDKIVDEYFTLIKERNQKNNLSKVSTLSTHAFQKLEQDFDENFHLIAERWVKEDLTTQDKVLISNLQEGPLESCGSGY